MGYAKMLQIYLFQPSIILISIAECSVLGQEAFLNDKRAWSISMNSLTSPGV